VEDPSEFAGHVPCPDGHNVVYRSTKGPIMRKGQDYDSYVYDVVDSTGTVVASYEVRDSMSTNPPFDKSVEVVLLK
jgi:hypothetical protein